MAATVGFYKSKGGLPSDGVLSVSVPGAVAGAELAAKTYGTKTLAEVLAPAAELADRGFPVTESLAGALRSSREKLSPSSRKIWFKVTARDGTVWSRILRTLRIGEGSAAFYQAPSRRSSRLRAGGLIDEKDLAGIRATRTNPSRSLTRAWTSTSVHPTRRASSCCRPSTSSRG
jgi:gamma-glutamyltranspeptidase/glutathione hydrolase